MRKQVYGTVATVMVLGVALGVTSACRHMDAGSETACASKSTKSGCAMGFQTSVEDGRLWVLKDGEKKSDKHISLIGAGPGGMTIKAANKDSAIEYLGAKPGFNVSVEDGRLWVLKDGEKKSDKHISLIGAGPQGVTLKAADRVSALEYLSAKPGFVTKVDAEGRIWVFAEGEDMKMPEKHITRVGAGPMKTTLKAVNGAVLDAYCISK